MIYDSYCFERHSCRLEEAYLAGNFTGDDEVKMCQGYCDEKAVIEIDGEEYCLACAGDLLRDTDEKVKIDGQWYTPDKARQLVTNLNDIHKTNIC